MTKVTKVNEVKFFIPDNEDEVHCHEYNPFHDFLLGIVRDLDIHEYDGIEFVAPYPEREWCG